MDISRRAGRANRRLSRAQLSALDAQLAHAIESLRSVRISLAGSPEPAPSVNDDGTDDVDDGPVELISVKRAAGLLQISERRVRSLAATGRLPAWHSDNGRWWISADDALRLLAGWTRSGRS
jgi:hypothetical protein